MIGSPPDVGETAFVDRPAHPIGHETASRAPTPVLGVGRVSFIRTITRVSTDARSATGGSVRGRATLTGASSRHRSESVPPGDAPGGPGGKMNP
ncbi:hypothetical protein GOPIP_070_02040 [Gordonia polyisoprenivorans NBRC 16320 = JCM 10675]|nr:hypothetical protein GOPIP_070_02040 [Gordonia polyisoprenivorans NBRC 16320 = JCM 10675]